MKNIARISMLPAALCVAARRREVRPAGARTPAPSTSAGSRRPDARARRARARRLTVLLPVLALLAGAFSLFAAAPAGAQTAPSVPQNVKIVPGNNRVTMTWEAPASWGTYPANAFEWGPSHNTGRTLGVSPSSTSQIRYCETRYPPSFACNGATETWRVRARSRQAGSNPAVYLYSAWVEVTVTVGVPGTPTGLTATPGNQKLDLAWTAPSGNSNAVTGYDVHYTSAAAGTVANGAAASGSDASAAWVDASHSGTTAAQTIPSLANDGTTYRWRVRATNARGTGPWAFGTGQTPIPVRLSVTPTTVVEGQSVTVTATRTVAGPAVTIPVTVSTSDPDTAEPGDVGALAGIAIAEGATSATATLMAEHDADTLDETFTVALGSLPNTHVPEGTTSVQVTIDDDDMPTVSLSVDQSRPTEGESVTLTVTLSSPISGAVTIPLTVSLGTAESGDITVPGSITIAAQQTTGTGTLATHHDGGHLDETFTVRLGSTLPTAVLPGSPASVALTIRDDEGNVRVSFARSTMTLCEGGPQKYLPEFVLSRQPDSFYHSIRLTGDRGTAEPHDHTFPGVATISIRYTSEYFKQTPYAIRANHDGDWEFEEFTVEIDREKLPDGFVAAPDRPTKVTVTIVDDDLYGQDGCNVVPARISVTDDGVHENADRDFMRFVLTLDRAAPTDVTVRYRTVDGTATAGSDYKATSGTLTFGHGYRRQEIRVPVFDDNVEDSGETFRLVLSNPQGAVIEKGEATGTIYNDEHAGAEVQLTAAFERAPARHEGSAFWFDLRFKEALGETSNAPSAASFTVKGGRIDRVWKVEDGLWRLRVAPEANRDVTVTLAGGRACDAAGAVCTADGRALSNSPSATVAAPERELSSNANLSGLSAEAGTDGNWSALKFGAFAAGTTTYSAAVPYGTTHARLTATAAHSGATLKAGAGASLTAVTSGTAGGAIPLAVGANALKVEVTAENGAKKTYTVTVTREERVLSSNANLAGLSVEAKTEGGWTALGLGAFAAGTTAYAAKVPNGTTHVRLTAAAAHAAATLKAGVGASLSAVASGATGAAIPLSVGANALAVQVTAEDGTKKTYVVTVEREAPPLTARLRTTVAEHDGETPFMVELVLSESLESGSRWPSAASFEVKYGSVESVRAFRPYRIHVHVKPKSWRDVTVTLAGGRACDEAGAVCTADGRSVSNTSSVTVGGPVRIRVEGARAREGRDASLDFAVTLNRAASHEVSVDYATADETATAGEDYTATSGTLTFAAGETAKTVSVPVLDDAVDEGKEVMRLLLSNPKGAYLRNVHTRARGVITNDDPLQRMWLARFGRAAAGHVAEAIDGRLSGGGAAGVVLGGQSLSGGGAEREDLESRLAETLLKEREVRLGRGEEAQASSVREVAMSDLLLASSFHMASAEKVDAGSRWSLWGRGARSSFEGAEGDLSLDGDVTTATVGFDYERARWLVGVALSRSAGDGSYKAGGACEAGCAGEVESTLTGVYPYARYRVSGTFSLWGAVGHGQGEMTLTPGGSSPVEADVSMGMAAAGARGVVLPAREAGGFELALRADVLVTNTRSDAAAGLAETDAETSRVRLVLEGSRSLRFGDAVLTPSLEIGFRNDSGDAETGGGVEAGGGLRWSSGALTTEVRARGLLSHGAGGYEEWGVSASVAYAPGSGGRGLTLRAGSSWGASAGGAERLWSQAAGLAPAGAFEPGAAGFEAEAAWGLDAPQGLLTPYTGVAVSGNGETWRAGARWKPGAATEVSLEASLTEQAGGGRPEGGLLLKGSKRW